MKCHRVREKIPDFLEERLSAREIKEAQSHIDNCPVCLKVIEQFKNIWEILGELPDIEPQPGYIGRFWTSLSLQKTWQERIWAGLEGMIFKRRWIPALATACIVVSISMVSVFTFSQKSVDRQLAELSEDDLEMVENIELAENLDLLSELDFYENMNIIEHLDKLES